MSLGTLCKLKMEQSSSLIVCGLNNFHEELMECWLSMNLIVSRNIVLLPCVAYWYLATSSFLGQSLGAVVFGRSQAYVPILSFICLSEGVQVT